MGTVISFWQNAGEQKAKPSAIAKHACLFIVPPFWKCYESSTENNFFLSPLPFVDSILGRTELINLANETLTFSLVRSRNFKAIFFAIPWRWPITDNSPCGRPLEVPEGVGFLGGEKLKLLGKDVFSIYQYFTDEWISNDWRFPFS